MKLRLRLSRGRGGHDAARPAAIARAMWRHLDAFSWRRVMRWLCRKHGFSDATFYKWRSRLGGLDVSEARRLRELEAENTKLMKLLAEAMLDIESLKVVARGKW